jgi:uncharacterized delta-60 repeat protein
MLRRMVWAFFLLIMVVVALFACSGSTNTSPGGGNNTDSSKAITAFSFASPAATGTINESAKTISITVPNGTNITALIATFTTTGASVKVGSTIQVSGTTPNDFTNLVSYTVTAANSSTATYSVAVTISSPAAGTLDMTFGNGGKVRSAFGTNFDAAYAAAIQTDGKIVAAGCADTGTVKVFALARYNSTGSLDTTFGTGGKVTTAFGTVDDRAFAVAIQTDGKIVVGGYSNTGTAKVFALARYNSDGTLDTSFGTGGKVTTAIGTADDSARDVAILSDGKIVLAGYSNTGAADIFALSRYNSNGTLDTSFGTGGKVTTAFGTFRDRIEAIAITSDQKIVAVGHSWNGLISVIVLARYIADGSLDSSFGSGGKVTTAVGTSDSYGYSVALQANGKIVAAGWSWSGANVFALARYNIDGSLDANFGAAGLTTTAFGTSNAQAFDIAIQADGKVVAAGWSIDTTYTYYFALSRYNIDGTLDSSFGTGGELTTAFGSLVDYACAVDIQSDGKIVTSGLSWTSASSSSFALARYWP